MICPKYVNIPLLENEPVVFIKSFSTGDQKQIEREELHCRHFGKMDHHS